MHRSIRSRVRVSAAGLFRHRPRLERLEPRLPPGDALVGMLLAWPDMCDVTTSNLEHALFASRDGADEGSSALSNLRRESRAESQAITIASDDATSSAATQRAAELSVIGLTAGINPAARHAELGQRMEGFSQTAHASVPGLAISAPRAAGYNPAVRTATSNGPTALAPAGLTVGIYPAARQESGAVENYGNLPLTFEANHGQTDAGVDFIARAGGATMFVTPTALVMAISELHESPRRAGGVNPLESAANQGVNTPRSPKVPGVSVHMQIVGANPDAQPTGVNQQPGIVNYFIGDDPSQWHSNIPTFGGVRYDDVYPGIDLAYHGNGGQLEYDFIVSSGGDPDAIMLNFAGAEAVDVNAQGDLVLHTPAGELVQQKPFTYQEVGGIRREVASGYVVDGTEVRFDVGAYDATRELVIDPLVLRYSTFLGGSTNNEEGDGIAVDGNGNAYITGWTDSTDFPTTPGALDTTKNLGSDVFVTKLNPTGSALVYSTYLGGTNRDNGKGIAVDAGGHAFVAGFTESPNFPTTSGAYDTIYNVTQDGFLAKLRPDGTALVYSTFLGGSGLDDTSGIAVDAGGNAYTAGKTRSCNFPTTPGAFDNTLNEGNCTNQRWDAFVSKLNADGSDLSYSTYLGGSGDDRGTGGIALDANDNAYVTGLTDSADFPTTPGVFDTTHSGGYNSFDAFVAKLSATGSALGYSSYMGGAVGDYGYGIAVDAQNHAYVTGRTESTGFPTTEGAFDIVQNGRYDVFVTKVSPDASVLVYSTYIGGFEADEAYAIAIDAGGAAYVTGQTYSPNFPTTGDALDSTFNGAKTAFVTKLNAAGSALVYSTYLGGTSFYGEYGSAIAADSADSVYVSGLTFSRDFPITPGAFKRRNRGSADAFITKFAEV